MSETTEPVPGGSRQGVGPEDVVAQRVRALQPGVAALVAEAEATWLARVGDGPVESPGRAGAGWRAFEDAFPTFYQFTNRPPR